MGLTPDTPMLFLPPQPPVPVLPGRALVIGRSRSCDLRLPSGDASRRHAEIIDTAEGYVLRDLESTNGSFVNGELVREHVISPGDRTQISGHTITFCHVACDADDSDSPHTDEHTVLLERPVPQEAFRGELAQVPPFALLQMLELGRKTGAVEIRSDAGGGCLWLVDGRPVHAETKSQKGFDAAIALVNASAGSFRFESENSAPEITIEASVTELLLESARLQDEDVR
jgi:pSer/pThr/pTyr-binding forkhead associated (FHA) protein